MTEKGIKETKEALLFFAALGNGMGKSAADGKFQLGDILHFIPAATKVPAAVGGVAEIPAEIADLTSDEVTELTTAFSKQFDLPWDTAEVLIEKGLPHVLGLVMWILEFRKALEAE